MAHRKEFIAFGKRVGYSQNELDTINGADPRVRHVAQLTKVASKYSIFARVVSARHCNSGYREGDRFVIDVDGNFINKLCPPRICVYLASQMMIPVALINERFSEGLDPERFHFMRRLQCQDCGVENGGYGQVMVEMSVGPRQ